MMIIRIAMYELRRLFASPLAWLLLATIQFLAAMFFYVLLSRYLGAAQSHGDHGLTETVAAGTLQITGIIVLLITPFLTMRLFSDEQRSGTINLLFSSPVSVTELVLGKYLGVTLLLFMALVMVALMPLSLLPGTPLDLGLLAAGLLGLALLMLCFAAIGLFISTLTAQPVTAASATFAALFLLWVIHIAGSSAHGALAGVFAWLSLLRHFNALLRGVVSSVDVAYFLLLGTAFLLLSIWRLDAMRTHHW
jgi:ABC-2 type transport system permease protein